jgi:hypothetical protein
MTTLHASSWLDETDVQPKIAHELKLSLAADTGTWTPTAAQIEMIHEALNNAFDLLREYASDLGYDLVDWQANWDMREHWQFVGMMCFLGRSEFLAEDPQDSEWPEKFCTMFDAFLGQRRTLFGVNGVTELDKDEDGAAIAAKQARWTSRNGLCGANHDRKNDWNSDSVTRHPERLTTPNSNTLRS